MISHIRMTTVYVAHQDTALEFYTEKLGFEKWQDDRMGDGSLRWLVVRPQGAETGIVLYEDHARAGLFGVVFATDDIEGTFQELKGSGVQFTEEPTRQPWGVMQAQFVDPDGNGFVLVQPARD